MQKLAQTVTRPNSAQTMLELDHDDCSQEVWGELMMLPETFLLSFPTEMVSAYFF